MKAVAQDRYGPPDVLRIVEIDRPTPNANQVLVRVHASTVNQTDTHFRGAPNVLIRLATGLRRPRQRIAGRDFAGVVEAVGAAVTEFKVGDRVFGLKFGANAESIVVRQDRAIVTIPEGLTFEAAAAIPDGAFQGLAHLRHAKVGQGTAILIYGASGSCGTAAVQIAKQFGADVTAVTSTPNVELVRSLGADRVIDYTAADFTKNGQTYDVILDAVGKLSFLRTRRSLRPGGRWVATDGLRNLLWWLVTWRFGSRRLTFAVPINNRADLLYVRDLIVAGAYRAVIDRSYPMDQVIEAHRYVETWRKRGNVVLTIVPDSAGFGSAA